jgi:type I restriction enzyme R subunit
MKPEQLARQEIDKRLLSSGWDVDDPKEVIQEFALRPPRSGTIAEERSSYNGNSQFCDYVLRGKDGKILAVIEAKKSSQDAGTGREQAKQYCYAIQEELGGDLPFCLYSNGKDIFFWDIENYPSRELSTFPTRDDLEHFQYIRRYRKPLSQIAMNTEIAGRDYQIQAIRTVMEGIEEKRRKFLLVMATGTGKTRTCIGLVDALMRAGYVERVLFLVDRIALREQALGAFKEHLPHEPRWPNVGEKVLAKDRRIYVATYPTMLNIIQDEDQTLSPYFFDLIIVDESHRSIYYTYGELLRYFDTLMVGLTATPTDTIDHNTFKIFGCENGHPTFAYSYKEATTNKPAYLSTFQVMKIRTKFQSEGLNKRTISLEEQQRLLQDGQDIEEIDFTGSDLERIVTNRGTNVVIVREFMDECIKDDDGVLPGKTIFFCVSKEHARRVERIFDDLYPQYHGELARVIVSDDPRVYGKGGLLDQFVNTNFPRIAISVDMLDTGIDVREVVNLVFAKPVYSYTKFWQMIGRGTRLLESAKLKPWCTQKDGFLILDCWDNFDYFKLEPNGRELKVQVPLPVRVVGLRIDKLETAYDQDDQSIVASEAQKLRHLIARLPKDSIVIRDAATLLREVEADTFWQQLDHQRFEWLRQQIKPLFRTLSNVDTKAMRFERTVLEYSLCLMREEKQQAELLRESIVELIRDLPLSIGFVQREATLIRDAQTATYWQSAGETEFDRLVERLGPLMCYRDDNAKAKPLELDLADSVQVKQLLQIDTGHANLNIEGYRSELEAKIAELRQANPVLLKIQQGETVSEDELAALSKALEDDSLNISDALLRRVYNNPKADFLQFIRHILGVEILESFPVVVNEAFEHFIQQHSTLNSQQLNFLALLKDVVLQRGQVSRKDLISAPFTVIHPAGIRGVFTPQEISEIVQLTERLAA